MFNYEHSGDQNLRSIPLFEKPNIPFSRNPDQFLRRPFPQLRRRMMSNRYANVGFRPLGQPAFRPDFPNSQGRVLDFRYSVPNRLAPPSIERQPFTNTFPHNPFEIKNLQHPPPRQSLIGYHNNQTVIESPAMNELNSVCDMWVEALAPNGRKYFYNARTRLTSWERPMNVRIIDLNEIIRLQNFSASEQAQNFQKENQAAFVPQQPFNSCGQIIYPRNFPMPQRLMVLPPPQNAYNPPQIYPAPSTESISQNNSCYTFNPIIPPMFSVPAVNVNMITSNENSTSSTTPTGETSDTLQSVSHSISEGEFKSSENKISDWSVLDSEVPEHTNMEQDDACNQTSRITQEVPESNNFRPENCNQTYKMERVTEPPSEISSVETDKPHSEQQFEGLKDAIFPASLTLSSTHIPGTNWYVISTEGKTPFYFDNLRKISVWEKPNELNDLKEVSKLENLSEDNKNNIAQENSPPGSENCESKTDIPLTKTEDSTADKTESLSEQKMEIKNEEQVDKSRPASSTPVSGTTWFVVWTGDERVFYFDSQNKISVWKRPKELLNRSDVDKLIEKPPSVLGLKTLKKEVRKIESSDSDSIKKLKKEDEKEESILNQSTDNEIIEKNDNIQQVDAISHEEKVKIFCEMLAEKKVSAFSTWEKELHKIVFDSRYLLLPSKERKQTFESYISRKVDEEKNERRKELQHQKEKFISLLKDAGVTWKSRFSDFALRHGKDVRFKSVEKIKQKENIFNQYISDLLKKEKEHECLKNEKKKKFTELLKEHNFTNKDTWCKIQEKIAEDERYKAIQSNSTKEKLFKEYLKELSSISISKEKEDRIHASIRNREEEVKRDLSVHLKDRERERDFHNHLSAVSDFKALLNDLIRTPDINWHSAKKLLKADRRWELSLCLESEDREELFNEHINMLNSKKKEQFHHLLDEMPEITLKTSWLDVRKDILNDPRCSKFSSSERKCEREFKDYLKKKFLDAKADFKKLLQETKIITYKSKSLLKDTNHMKDLEEILSLDKRYLNLEYMRNERKEMLLSYINKLHEEGPPPPPTASDSSNRLKCSK